MSQLTSVAASLAPACRKSWAGQQAAFGDTPCPGELFAIQQQCQSLSNIRSRQAQGATCQRQQIAQQMQRAKQLASWASAFAQAEPGSSALRATD